MAVVEEFCLAAKEKWPNCLIQFEDFQTDKAFAILEKFRDKFLCFNGVQRRRLCLDLIIVCCIRWLETFPESLLSTDNCGIASVQMTSRGQGQSSPQGEALLASCAQSQLSLLYVIVYQPVSFLFISHSADAASLFTVLLRAHTGSSTG